MKTRIIGSGGRLALWAVAALVWAGVGGTAWGYEPGLFGGKIGASAMDTTTFPSTTNVYAGPASSTTTASTVWGDNKEWIYWGEMRLTAGTNWFAECIDEATYLVIDGTVVLNDKTWDHVGVGSFVAPADGWYAFELRMWNGSGGAGPAGKGGWPTTMGFGYKFGGASSTTYTDYAYPEDPGDMSLFRCGEPGADGLIIAGAPEALGVVSPSYGTTNGLASGDSFLCSASEGALNEAGDILYSCAGWTIATNGAAGWETMSSGAANSCTYVHPGVQARLTWNWEPIACLLTTNTYQSGTVAADPAPQTNGLYRVGTSVTLTATPASGYVFHNWVGDVADAAASETVLVTTDTVQTVTARFSRQAPYDVYDVAERGGTIVLGDDYAGEVFGAAVITNGSVAVTGTGSQAILGSIAKGASLDLSAVAFTSISVTNSGAGRIVLPTGSVDVVFAADAGVGVLELPFGCVATVSGAGKIGSVEGEGRLVKSDDAELTLAASELTGPFDIAAGTVRFLYNVTSNDVLGTRPSLWLDPGNTNAYTRFNLSPTPGVREYTYVNATGGTVVANSDNTWACYPPHVVTNGLNGLTIWDYGFYNSYPTNAAHPTKDWAYLRISPWLYPRQVFLVFGSQNGGGHVYGDGEFTRAFSGSVASGLIDPSVPIAKKTWNSGDLKVPMIPFWIDGRAVDPFATGLSGGWQILSFSPHGKACKQSGGATAWWDTAGGMKQGEQIFFDEPLNAAERYAVGHYLSEKWGLPWAAGIETPTPITVAVGATLKLDGPYEALRLSGAGAVVSSGDAVTSINGGLSGTVTVPDGGTLRLGTLRAVPGSECVPASPWDGVSGETWRWWDASRTLTEQCLPAFQFATNEMRTLNILSWSSLLSSNACFYPKYDTTAPWLHVITNADGAVHNWVDCSTNYTRASTQNQLSYKTHYALGGGDTTFDYFAAFLACDSTDGGGYLLEYSRDAYDDASSPLAGSSASTYAKTRPYFLNGARVEPTTTGFTGGPEVLAQLSMTNGVCAKREKIWSLFGQTKGAGRVGEVVLLDTVPNAAGVADIQAYLAKKWAGKTLVGYGDGTATNAQITCSGTGRLVAEYPWLFPPAANVSGTFTSELTGTNWTYRTRLTGKNSAVVEPACGTASGALTVPAAGTIRVTVATGTPEGFYPVLQFPAGLDGASSFAGWTFIVTDENGVAPKGVRPSISVTPNRVSILVPRKGFFISIR